MSAPLTAPAEAHAPDPDRAGPDAPNSDAPNSDAPNSDAPNSDAPNSNAPDPDAPDLTPAWLAHIIARIILFILQHKLSHRRGRRQAWWHDPSTWSPRSRPPSSGQPRPAPRRNPLGDAIDELLRQRGLGSGPAKRPGLPRGNLAPGGSVGNPPAGAPPGPPSAPPGPPAWWEHSAIVEFMLAVVDATMPPAAPPAQQEFAGAPPLASQTAPPRTTHGPVAVLWRRAAVRAGHGPPIRAGTGPPIGARAGPSAVRDDCHVCNA